MTTTANSPLALIDARILVAGADLTGASNKIGIDLGVDALDSTVFGLGGGRRRRGGLLDTNVALEGLWTSGSGDQPDDAFWTNLGRTAGATFWPEDGTLGDPCVLTQILRCTYKQGGDVGKLFAWGADLRGIAPAVRGVTLHSPNTLRSASGTGVAQLVAAIPAGQRMYVNLHVISIGAVAGTPTLTVVIESDVDATFASPTTQATLTTVSATGGQAVRISGPVTDTYWRAKWTVAGGATTPSILFAVASGVGPK